MYSKRVIVDVGKWKLEQGSEPLVIIRHSVTLT